VKLSSNVCILGQLKIVCLEMMSQLIKRHLKEIYISHKQQATEVPFHLKKPE
jgi:hypothetical protein